MTGPGQEGEFARKLLAHCPLTTVGAGDAQQMMMPWATAAAFMLPHVSLGNDAASVKVFTVYVNPAAWSRWWNAITSLAFTPGDAEAAALGVVQARITQRLAVASDATRLQLTLTAADLSAVQADLEYAEGAVQANFADGEPEAEKLRRELKIAASCSSYRSARFAAPTANSPPSAGCKPMSAVTSRALRGKPLPSIGTSASSPAPSPTTDGVHHHARR